MTRPPAMIVDILLAAGRGTRMGSPKALLHIDDRALVTRALDEIAASPVDATIVVTGAEADAVAELCRRPGVLVAHNAAFDSGQTSSLQTGLRALTLRYPTATAFLVHPVDHALVRRDHLAALLTARSLCATPDRTIFRPVFAGDWGHPVLYPTSYAREFLAIAPDASARPVYRAHLPDVVGVPMRDRACSVDLDTPADLAALRAARAAGHT